MVIGEVGIGPILATITPMTQVTMVDYCLYLVLLAMLMIVFTKMEEVIAGLIIQDMEVGLKRSPLLLSQ